MEPQPISDFSSTVDTSRAFSSVKEAVAIFDERLVVGSEIYSPKPLISFSDTAYSSIKRSEASSSSWRFSSPSPMKVKPKEEDIDLVDTVKKLEAELEKTKVELKLLKERESETEVALATLNADLHKNMSKLAQAEAAAAGKAAVATKTVRFDIDDDRKEGGVNMNMIMRSKDPDSFIRRRMEDSQTLRHILNLGENDHLCGEKKVRKHKPIIPLVGDFFLRAKRLLLPITIILFMLLLLFNVCFIICFSLFFGENKLKVLNSVLNCIIFHKCVLFFFL